MIPLLLLDYGNAKLELLGAKLWIVPFCLSPGGLDERAGSILFEEMPLPSCQPAYLLAF